MLQIVFKRLKNKNKKLETVHILDGYDVIKFVIDEILPHTQKVFVWDITMRGYEFLTTHMADITASHIENIAILLTLIGILFMIFRWYNYDFNKCFHGSIYAFYLVIVFIAAIIYAVEKEFN